MSSGTIDDRNAQIAQLEQGMTSDFAEIASGANGFPANQPASVSSSDWARMTTPTTGSAARLAQARANLASVQAQRNAFLQQNAQRMADLAAGIQILQQQRAALRNAVYQQCVADLPPESP